MYKIINSSTNRIKGILDFLLEPISRLFLAQIKS